MVDHEAEFAYTSRRARQEEVAAINAAGDAAAIAHRQLSRLYVARALVALLDPNFAKPDRVSDQSCAPYRRTSTPLSAALC